MLHARRHLRSRATIAACAGVAALLRACSLTVADDATLDGLSRLLASRIGGEVQPDDVAWEPSRGSWVDATLGRRALFLGARDGGLRDVYRARISVTAEGKPVRVLDVVNLTNTERADERGLASVQSHAVYTTVVDDEVATMTSLELAGRFRRPGETWLERLLSAFASWREHGSLQGIGRTHYELKTSAVEISFSADDLRVSVAPSATGDGRTSPGDVGWRQFVRVSSVAESFAAIAATLWGPSSPQHPEESHASPPASIEVAGARTSTPTRVESSWPPEPLAVAGVEAPWHPFPAGGEEPPLFMHSHWDSGKGKRLHVVAMDLRRMELRMQGGYDAPRGPFGPPGFGRVDDAEVAELVGVFNGAGPSAPPGMRVLGRDIAPPLPGGASVVLTDGGRVGLGFWPDTTQVPAGIRSLRQASFALVVNGRARVLTHDVTTAAARSGLCGHRLGTLLYAWDESATWQEFAGMLAELGCEFALALGPESGFGALGRPGELDTASPLAQGMSLRVAEVVQASADDFFYLLRRNTTPRVAGESWTVSPGAQPEPAVVPALFQASSRAGSLALELFLVSAGRVAWALVSGQAEPLLEGRAAPKRELGEHEAANALFALDLGHTTRATRYGMAFGPRESLPLRNLYATLAASEDGELELFGPEHTPTPTNGTVYVQLPQLVAHGQLTQRAAQAGGHRRRGALCVLPSGQAIVAFAEHDSSAPLALHLVDRGCDSVVELDRASQHRANLYRAGTSNAVPKSSETTLLVGTGRSMPQGTFIFGGNDSVEP